MARIPASDLRVRKLLEETLIPAFLASGSTAALCDQLNATLAAGDGRIYPNRLHALLSDDPRRGVQERTLLLIERAALCLGEELDRDGAQEAEDELWNHCLRETSDLAQVDLAHLASSVGAPPAVVRWLLQRHGPPGADTPRSFWPQPEPRSSSTPDWRFQDEAVEQCLRRLRATPGRKLGVVLPTGGGKTRLALRVALDLLHDHSDSDVHVLWVTHRINLQNQARRELQSMVSEGATRLPDDVVSLLAGRIRFIMLGELESRLLKGSLPALVIVDEAHHAAAASYEPIFAVSEPLPALFLTATPNRTDGLPIGIDEIAYTITYRELANRGVILIPTFEDFPVEDFDWSPEAIHDLADFVISRSADDFVKTLVLAPRVDRVEEFYKTLVDRLAEEPSHLLSLDDLGYVHGTGNSLGTDNDEFITHFGAKPRAILVSAQLLLEGFNDPAINAVVVTYPSSSLVRLMQAAGRSVRTAPRKNRSYVVQARNDELAYHFDQRWLYQEISDHLRPELLDIQYSSRSDLHHCVRTVLGRHRVLAATENSIQSQLEDVQPGERCRLFLCGLPYYGAHSSFESEAPWTAILETESSSEMLREVFNHFCAVGADLSDPSAFLEKRAHKYGLRRDYTDGSRWRALTDLLTAAYFACKEIYGDGSSSPQGVGRPFRHGRATTWLRYVTFEFQAAIPAQIQDFLANCVNRTAILARYQRDPDAAALMVRLPLPLGRFQAYLFGPPIGESFAELVAAMREQLRGCVGDEQFAQVAAYISQAAPHGLPLHLVQRLENFTDDGALAANTLPLPVGGANLRELRGELL